MNIYMQLAHYYKSKEPCQKLADLAEARPIFLASNMFKVFRRGSRDIRNRKDFVDFKAHIASMEDFAEEINVRYYKKNPDMVVKAVNCVPRAVMLAATLLNTRCRDQFLFTGYKAPGNGRMGHIWVLLLHNGTFLDVDASAPAGVPIEKWRSQRDNSGFNKPSEIAERVRSRKNGLIFVSLASLAVLALPLIFTSANKR